MRVKCFWIWVQQCICKPNDCLLAGHEIKNRSWKRKLCTKAYSYLLCLTLPPVFTGSPLWLLVTDKPSVRTLRISSHIFQQTFSGTKLIRKCVYWNNSSTVKEHLLTHIFQKSYTFFLTQFTMWSTQKQTVLLSSCMGRASFMYRCPGQMTAYRV